MRIAFVTLFLAVFSACGEHIELIEGPNRWSDARLIPVLEAQEHRDTPTLCTLLSDTSATIREAAALAMASVQDSTSTPCLLKALHDEHVGVRSTAAFALGFIADSAAVQQMAEQAIQERDSTVQRALLSASFIAMQRNGQLTDPNAILYYFERGSGHERARAADALRRLPDSALKSIAADYLVLFDTIDPGGTDAMLTLILGRVGGPEAEALARRYAQTDMPVSLRMNALRALATFNATQDDDLYLEAAREGALGSVAIEGLFLRYGPDHVQLMAAREAALDPILATQLLGMAFRTAGNDMDSIEALVHHKALTDPSPYVRAAAIRIHPSQFGLLTRTEAVDLLIDPNAHPAVRQAAFISALLDQHAEHLRQYQQMIRPEEFERWSDHRSPMHEAISSGDAGLICAALEQLIEGGGDPDSIVVPPELERMLRDTLRPLADLEALRLLDQVLAMRAGISPFLPDPIPFNHPIDHTRLLALKQGQRYRITTAKGEILLATDVNECPGSSLVFDSLAVAGYYNGKAFHRMVPNFVLQGGCPRGDGYGGMPWTLRTEIGRKLFTAGSIGLASAGRDTESCQFFITHSATPHLDGRYTRFGEVVSGMDVVWRLQVGDEMERVERVE
jgi:cyclophilin family peptidyl-prolyl cis-trans isomerase/HEAT repeat protein